RSGIWRRRHKRDGCVFITHHKHAYTAQTYMLANTHTHTHIQYKHKYYQTHTHTHTTHIYSFLMCQLKYLFLFKKKYLRGYLVRCTPFPLKKLMYSKGKKKKKDQLYDFTLFRLSVEISCDKVGWEEADSSVVLPFPPVWVTV